MSAGQVNGKAAESMESLLEAYLPSSTMKRGAILRGTVVRVSPNEVVVDVGTKAEGVISGRELEALSPEALQAIRPGEVLHVFVVQPEDADGNVVLSLAKAQAETDWNAVQQVYDKHETVRARVVGYNKGGVLVQVGQLRGFVPGSQLDPSRHAHLIGRESRPDGGQWQGLINAELELRVMEIDRWHNRLILSEREAQRERRKVRRDRLLAELEPDTVRTGRVTNLTDFGAFVDLGGIDGLVHLSELSWKRVLHPSALLEIGQEVQVYVLNVDRDQGRIALSLKRLHADPWEGIEARYQVGQLVRACITRLTKFGAFACIVGDEAIEGLIHISELEDQHGTSMGGMIHSGDMVTLRVVQVNGERRRLGLSLKQALAAGQIGPAGQAGSGGQGVEQDMLSSTTSSSAPPSTLPPSALEETR